MDTKELLSVLETRITNIKKENHTHFNEGRVYELELTVGVVKSLLNGVISEFKEKYKTDIKALEKKRYILSEDKEKCHNNIDAWCEEMSYINGKIIGLKTALNYL